MLFIWQAIDGKIAVLENLRKRGVVVDGEGVCVLCGQSLETEYHLLVACRFVIELWNRIMAREGVVWCCLGSLQELLYQWEGLRVKSLGELWCLVPYALGWTVWMERNDAIFRGKEPQVEHAWHMLLTKIFWWIKAAKLECSYGLYEFMQHFELVRLETECKVRKSVEWERPEVGVMKFNVEGAARGTPGRGGIGGVLRDWRG